VFDNLDLLIPAQWKTAQENKEATSIAYKENVVDLWEFIDKR
jgi:hypothetical protein